MKKDIKPLYRKVNTTTRMDCGDHFMGSDAKYDRNTKDGVKKNMKRNVQRGLDYTPLYKFLLSKVGEDWDKIYSEAIKRLDCEEPIYHIVLKCNEYNRFSEVKDRYFVRVGESSYYSALFVDDDNILRVVNPDFKNEDMAPSCPCCTHTFNGKIFVKKYNPLRDSGVV